MSDYDETIPVAGIRRLDVRIARGDVTLRRISGDSIQVRSDRPIAVTREGDAVGIRSESAGARPRTRARSPHPFNSESWGFGAAIGDMVSTAVESILAVDFDFSGFGSADIEVDIPASFELPDLVASTGMGDIRLADLTANCSLQTSKGDIDIDNCGGSLKATTGMGDISVDHFAGPVAVHTGAGDAELTSCDGGGVLHTGSGDIKAAGVVGAWNVRSGAGDVEMRITGEASLDIVTGAGDVKVERGSLHRLAVHSGSGDVRCTSLLDGPRHECTTGHGDIEVAIADPPGARLQILTRSGSVESDYPLVGVGKQGRYAGSGGRYVGSIGDSSIDVELRTTSGDITIKRRSPGRTEDGEPWRHTKEGPSAGYVPPAFAGSPAPTVPPVDFAPPNSPEPFSAPNPPIEPARPVSPPAFNATPEETPATPGSAVITSGGNPRLAILENLQAGKISVNEAAALLESLSRPRPTSQ